jgi:hypothetical protein
MRVDRRAWLCAWALGVAGCISNVPIGHGEPSSGDDAGVSEDSASVPPPSGDASSDGSDSVLASGYVELSPEGPQPSSYELLVTAAFARGGPGGEPPGCSTRTVEACVVAFCPTPPPAAAMPVTVSAGNLEVGALTVSPETDGGYEGYSELSGPWPAGELVHVHSTGGVVPAFSTELVVPPALTVTEPPGPPLPALTNLPGKLSKSGVTVGWKPLPSPLQAAVSVVQNWSSGTVYFSAVVVDCLFDGTLGTASIPAAALTDLSTAPPGPSGPSTELDMGSWDMVPVTAENAQITVYATAPGMRFAVQEAVSP